MTRRTKPARLVLGVYATVVGLFILLPTLVVVPLSFTDSKTLNFPPSGWSFRWYQNFFNDPQWYDSALFSIKVAVLVTLVATTVGTVAALALQNMNQRWAGFFRGILVSPMIVPGVITAIGVFYVYLRLGLTQTLLGFVFAHSVLAVPFVLVTVSASLQTFDRHLLRAAASCGSGPIKTFVKVTAPLIAPGILTGATFAFLTSFDEAIVSLFLAGPFTRTLPIQIYQSVTSATDPTIAAAATMLFCLTSLTMLVATVIPGRKK